MDPQTKISTRRFWELTFLLLLLVLQEDLVHTLGESASQGAAGVILWGSTNYSYSEVSKCRRAVGGGGGGESLW